MAGSGPGQVWEDLDRPFEAFCSNLKCWQWVMCSHGYRGNGFGEGRCPHCLRYVYNAELPKGTEHKEANERHSASVSATA